jgi:MFS family permease
MSLSFSVLRVRDFRLFLCARIFGLLAMQAQAVIVGWQLYELTKDPLMLGLIGLAEAIPAITCAFFAGHFVDIGKPYRIYCLCFFLMSLISATLLLFAGEFFVVEKNILIAIIFVGIFLSGIVRSFIMPASFSLLSKIVARSYIPAASAWLSSGFQLGAIIGPAMAGLIYGGYGKTVAWFIPVCFLGGASFLLLAIKGNARHHRNENAREPALQSMLAGWRYILKTPPLLAIMALDMFAVLFGGAVAMLPAFADQILHVGSEGLGLLRASPAVGAIFAALFLAVRPFKIIHGKTLLKAVFGFGICMLGFGLSENFLLSLFLLALSGAFDSVSMVIRSTLLQLLTPEDMRGRISSVSSMFIISSNEIGAFESGVAAKALGLAQSVVFGAFATLFIVVSTAKFSPKLRNIKIDAK